MPKCSDILQYIFLTKFGFSKKWTNMIFHLISENWYFVAINGARYDFYSFSQGLRHDDPLSPSLFIFVVQVLCRSLNDMNDHNMFIPFSMPPNCLNINHLDYVDDIFIFSSGNILL